MDLPAKCPAGILRERNSILLHGNEIAIAKLSVNSARVCHLCPVHLTMKDPMLLDVPFTFTFNRIITEWPATVCDAKAK